MPENFDENSRGAEYIKAIIIVIPPKDGDIKYTAKINVASEYDQYNSSPDSVSSFVYEQKGQLTEIDVSELLPELQSSNYVKVNFELEKSRKAKTQVVGMRFQYVSTGGAAGPEGPQGPPGVEGHRAPWGRQVQMGYRALQDRAAHQEETSAWLRFFNHKRPRVQSPRVTQFQACSPKS